jgi:hypothetical protein
MVYEESSIKESNMLLKLSKNNLDLLREVYKNIKHFIQLTSTSEENKMLEQDLQLTLDNLEKGIRTDEINLTEMSEIIHKAVIDFESTRDELFRTYMEKTGGKRKIRKSHKSRKYLPRRKH